MDDLDFGGYFDDNDFDESDLSQISDSTQSRSPSVDSNESFDRIAAALIAIEDSEEDEEEHAQEEEEDREFAPAGQFGHPIAEPPPNLFDLLSTPSQRSASSAPHSSQSEPESEPEVAESESGSASRRSSISGLSVDSLGSLDSLFVDQPHHPAPRHNQFSPFVNQQLARQARELRRLQVELERLERQTRGSLLGLDRRDSPRPDPAPIRSPFFDAFHGLNPIEDELVEMEVVGARRRRRREDQTPGPFGPRTPTPAPAGAMFIDLTEVPDSPEEVQILPNANNRAPAPIRPEAGRRRPDFPPLQRNPRRQGSMNRRAPSFTRSDGSILGGAPVIDLTGMDDDAPANANNALPRPLAAEALPRLPPQDPIDLVNGNNQNQVNNAIYGLVRRGFAMRNFLNFLNRPAEVDVQILGGGLRAEDNMIPNPLAENLPNFNYRANGYNNGSPKPAYVAPPAARDGFSRGTGEDLAFVCPSCEQELKYDPDEEDPKSPPAKRARTRKDREEHHFWAVKECGHVYCRACYEHRKPTAKNPHRTTFRTKDGMRNKLFCAIEDCDTDVSNKGSWVGLFL